jgi:hypothetical protein
MFPPRITRAAGERFADPFTLFLTQQRTNEMAKAPADRRAQLQLSIDCFTSLLDQSAPDDLMEKMVAQVGGRLRFAQGTNECRLHGLVGTGTAGKAAALRSWIGKAQRELSSAPGGASQGA